MGFPRGWQESKHLDCLPRPPSSCRMGSGAATNDAQSSDAGITNNSLTCNTKRLAPKEQFLINYIRKFNMLPKKLYHTSQMLR